VAVEVERQRAAGNRCGVELLERPGQRVVGQERGEAEEDDADR
jgi:hypothetical protein